MSDFSNPLTEGGCLCGAVRYRISGPASDPTLCHCATCRRAAGSPVVAWVTVPRSGFALAAGQPVTYRSSSEVVRTFCGVCGTPLTYQHAKLPGEIDVTTCSLDEPEAHPPHDQVWTSHRLGWMARAGELPAFARRRGSP
ncbi:MAG TPA: GFA family protein [Thermoanaerobaculia bacterium]|nr:GFA family protein [Thermoanaerobaculia bacterium]